MPWLAWPLILAMCALTIASHRFGAPPEGDGSDPMGVTIMRAQSKIMVGAAGLPGQSGSTLLPQARQALDVGSIGQRQRFVVVAAELGGPAEGRAQLESLDALIEKESASLSDEERQVQDLLHELYPAELSGATGDEEYENALRAVEGLDPAKRALLVERLGWFGELALAPRGSAERVREAILGPVQMVAVIAILAAVALGFAGVAGFAVLVTMAVLALAGRLRSGMGPPGAHHGIYAETFAAWLILFLGLQLGGALLPGPPMMVIIAMFFLSLVALAWPVWRGVPWARVRQDIGLTAGRGLLLEPLAGIGAYLATLPLLAVGLLITLVLMWIQMALAAEDLSAFSPTGAPAHPVIVEMTGDALWPKLQVLFLAAVAAPIVEETMFRGVLYRHLRDATLLRGLRGGASVVLSSTLVAFLFAVIHPQGWVAIPALMSLAYGMTLVREWRGTLVPSMVLHGLSNGLVMLLLILLLGN